MVQMSCKEHTIRRNGCEQVQSGIPNASVMQEARSQTKRGVNRTKAVLMNNCRFHVPIDFACMSALVFDSRGGQGGSSTLRPA